MTPEHVDAILDYLRKSNALSHSVKGNPEALRGVRKQAYRVQQGMILRDFLKKYPVDPRKDPEHVPGLLRDAGQRRDAVQVEMALHLGFSFGFSRSCLPVLHDLLPQDWHRSHEDIAMVLQELHDPSSVDVLYHVAPMQFDYLSYDEAYALGVKCCYALGAINTPEGDAKLRALAEIDNPVIAKAALYQFDPEMRPVAPED